MNGILYCFTSPSNKKYIGITTRPNQRYDEHKRHSKTMDTYFYRAIRKYGFDKFDYSVLKQVNANTKKELWDKLTQLEIDYIDKYNTNNAKYGYNTTDGGDGVIGYKFTDEDRLKVSKGLKGKLSGAKNPRYNKPGTFTGKQHTKEAREKMSEAHKGKKLTEEHKAKIRKAVKGQKHTKDSRNKMVKVQTELRGKAVYCVELDKVYPSVSATARATNLTSSEVSAVCKGKRLTAKGYTFRYVVNGKVEEVKRENKATQPIYCIETEETFKSITECADKMNLRHQHISACINGRQKTTGGYSFKALS